eukprot:1108482-Prymnesium_polylepis.1
MCIRDSPVVLRRILKAAARPAREGCVAACNSRRWVGRWVESGQAPEQVVDVLAIEHGGSEPCSDGRRTQASRSEPPMSSRGTAAKLVSLTHRSPRLHAAHTRRRCALRSARSWRASRSMSTWRASSLA